MNCPHWLLALTIPFSRSDRAHTSPAGVGAGCAKGLLRTMPASLLRLPEDLGGPFRRECHCSRRVTERQRAFYGREPPGVTRAAASITDRSGTPAVAGGCPPERSGSLQEAGTLATPPALPAGHTKWWHAGGHPAFRMPPGARCATSFPLPSLPPNQGGGVRALPADALDLPHVTTMRRLHDAPPVLQGRDRAVTPR